MLCKEVFNAVGSPSVVKSSGTVVLAGCLELLAVSEAKQGKTESMHAMVVSLLNSGLGRESRIATTFRI